MIFKYFATLVGFCLSDKAIATPQPHIGMVNNDFIQDVGAVYNQVQAQGNRTFILAVKSEPSCLPLCSIVSSVEICVNATCTFFAQDKCVLGSERYSFTVIGPGDVHSIPVPGVMYASYQCSVDDNDIQKSAKDSIATTPHDSSRDGADTMVR